MPTFAYEAVDSKGKESKGVIEAATSDDAVNKIRKMGLLPIQVKTKGGAGKRSTSVATAVATKEPGKKSFLASFGRVSRKELTLFRALKC
jgi:type IV pilus assembly protein PilC